MKWPKLLHTHAWVYSDIVNVYIGGKVRHFRVLYCPKCGKVDLSEIESFPED